MKAMRTHEKCTRSGQSLTTRSALGGSILGSLCCALALWAPPVAAIAPISGHASLAPPDGVTAITVNRRRPGQGFDGIAAISRGAALAPLRHHHPRPQA